MKKIIAFLFTTIILVGCKDEPKKEKFSYKRVQDATENTVVKSMNDITINSNDQMLFDRSIIRVKAGETVTLKFNHMGDAPKKLREIQGGMSMGVPMFTLLIGIITWAM